MKELKDFTKYLNITAKSPNKLYAVVNKETNEIQRLTNKRCFMEVCNRNFELRKVNKLLEVSMLTEALMHDGYVQRGKFAPFTITFDLDKSMENTFPNAEFYRISYQKSCLDNPHNRKEINLFSTNRVLYVDETYYVVTHQDLGEALPIPNHIKAKKLAAEQKKEADENMVKIFNTFVRPNMKRVVEDMLADPNNNDITDSLTYLNESLEENQRARRSLYIDSDILKKIYTNALYNFLTDKFGKCGLKFDKSKLNVGNAGCYVLDITSDGPMSFDIK